MTITLADYIAALEIGPHEGCPCDECRPAMRRRNAARAAIIADDARPSTSTQIWYLAHPVSAPDRAGVEANAWRALRWLAWLRRNSTAVIVAPWIAGVLSGEDDADPAQRERALLDCEAVVRRMTGIIAVGGRWSAGMARERAVAAEVCDLTALGEDPPLTGLAVDALLPVGRR
ncbi:MAG: hypothetical protein H0U46_05625 [Actinobacteria bacterium]|nr:hypothetical protein [Actinomycetota bacterium]